MESGIHRHGIRNPQRGIQNPRLSWITLHGATFERAARLVGFESSLSISGILKSVDQSSLEDQDKQQIGFFVIRFTVKYSYRLVATAALNVLDFQFLKVFGSVRLSWRLCKILVQFVTFMLFSGHLGICLTIPKAAVSA